MNRKKTSKEIERKTMPAFLKGVDGRTVTGITSTMGVVDDGGDRIFNGAYTKTIAESSRRFRHLWQHGADGWDYGVTPPIAAIRSIQEVGRDALPEYIRTKWPDATGGLEVKREYLPTERGNEILEAYKAGIELEMSIGYRAVKVQYLDKDAERVSLHHWRDIYEIALLDTSDVNWGMNEATAGSKQHAHTRARTLLERLKQFRWKDCDDPALQQEFHLLCAHLAHKDDDDEATYTLWEYRSSESKNSCEFCQSLDGKQVITFDGDEPFSLAIPNPLCNWPKNCACAWDKTEGLMGAEVLGYPGAIRDYLGKAAVHSALQFIKTGARHSAADLARVNEIHKLIFDLGATNCDGLREPGGLVDSITDDGKQASRAERLIEPISLTPSLKRLHELELALLG